MSRDRYQLLVLVYKATVYDFVPPGETNNISGTSILFTDNIYRESEQSRGLTFKKVSLPLSLFKKFDKLPKPVILEFKTSDLSNRSPRPVRIYF